MTLYCSQHEALQSKLQSSVCPLRVSVKPFTDFGLKVKHCFSLKRSRAGNEEKTKKKNKNVLHLQNQLTIIRYYRYDDSLIIMVHLFSNITGEQNYAPLVFLP